VAVPGLEWPLQRRCKTHMPFCEATFGKPAVCRVDKSDQPASAEGLRLGEHGLPALAKTHSTSADAALAGLMLVEPSRAKRKEAAKASKAARADNAATPPPHPPSHYVLDLESMRALGYPVPEVSPSGELRAPEGFVWTAAPPPGCSHSDSEEQVRAGLVCLQAHVHATLQGGTGCNHHSEYHARRTARMTPPRAVRLQSLRAPVARRRRIGASGAERRCWTCRTLRVGRRCLRWTVRCASLQAGLRSRASAWWTTRARRGARVGKE